MTRASTPSSASVSRPRSVWTTTRSNRASSRRQRSRRDAVRRGSRSCAVKTDGARNRRWTSACGSASHCRCRTSGRARASDAQHVEVLDRLQRQPQPRAPEEPRRERVEPLAAPVAVRRRDVAEAEARRRELDVGAGAGERRGELVVVPRRERRRIGEQDAHRSSVDPCSSGPGTSFTATRSRRSAASFLDEMIELATADDPDVLCVQEVPAWALGRFTVGDVAARPTLGPLPSSARLGRRLTDSTTACCAPRSPGRGTRSPSRRACACSRTSG